MSSRYVNLQEFQRLSGLSDKALLHLLKHNQLRCEVRDGSCLVIDIESTETKALQESILQRQHETLNSHQDLISERLGTIVRDEMQSIVDEAIARLISEQE